MDHYTEPTTSYWQQILTAEEVENKAGPWQYGCPVKLPDGRFLLLPIRQLPQQPDHAVASLLTNAASFEVVDTLAVMLAEQLRPYAADVIVGLPTLGHALCPGLARKLGHTRYVPLGYSQKFWYDITLSTPVSSITSPGLGQRRLWIDPHQMPLLKDRRVVLVDDAISSGTTILAAWELLDSLGVNVVACGVAMKQGDKWKQLLGQDRASRVIGVFDSPLLQFTPGGWIYRS